MNNLPPRSCVNNCTLLSHCHSNWSRIIFYGPPDWWFGFEGYREIWEEWMDNWLDTLALYKWNKTRKKKGISPRQTAACKSLVWLRLVPATTKYLQFTESLLRSVYFWYFNNSANVKLDRFVSYKKCILHFAEVKDNTLKLLHKLFSYSNILPH